MNALNFKATSKHYRIYLKYIRQGHSSKHRSICTYLYFILYSIIQFL